MREKEITRATGNVFADPGYTDAEERQTRLRLAHAINEVLARRRLAAYKQRCQARPDFARAAGADRRFQKGGVTAPDALSARAPALDIAACNRAVEELYRLT